MKERKGGTGEQASERGGREKVKKRREREREAEAPLGLLEFLPLPLFFFPLLVSRFVVLSPSGQ